MLPAQAEAPDVPEVRQEARHRQQEAYTSRTRSWDGFVHQHLGGTKTVSDGMIIVNRDMNGAREIILRALYDNLGRFHAMGADVALVAE